MAFLRWSKAAKLNGRRKLVNRNHVLGRKLRFLVTPREFIVYFFSLINCILFYYFSFFPPSIFPFLFLHQRGIWRGDLIYLTLGLDSFQHLLLSHSPPGEQEFGKRWIKEQCSAFEEDLFGYSSVRRAGG